MADPTDKNLMLTIDGVRYRREDAERFGLIKKEKDDGGTVSGGSGGPGAADEPSGDKPDPIARSRSRKQ